MFLNARVSARIYPAQGVSRTVEILDLKIILFSEAASQIINKETRNRIITPSTA